MNLLITGVSREAMGGTELELATMLGHMHRAFASAKVFIVNAAMLPGQPPASVDAAQAQKDFADRMAASELTPAERVMVEAAHSSLGVATVRAQLGLPEGASDGDVFDAMQAQMSSLTTVAVSLAAPARTPEPTPAEVQAAQVQAALAHPTVVAAVQAVLAGAPNAAAVESIEDENTRLTGLIPSSTELKAEKASRARLRAAIVDPAELARQLNERDHIRAAVFDSAERKRQLDAAEDSALNAAEVAASTKSASTQV